MTFASTRLKPLHAAVWAIFGAVGLTLHTAAFADSITGTFTDITGTTTSTGPTVNATSNNGQLSLGLNWVSSGYNGNIATATMSATSVSGMTPRGGSVNNLGSLSEITYTTVFTNNTGAAGTFDFNLNLQNSSLLVVPDYVYPNGAGTATATIGASVEVNGNNIWSSGATLSTTSNESQKYAAGNLPTYSFTTSGDGFTNGSVNLVDMQHGSFNGTDYEQVSFGSTSLNLVLGLLQPGQSETITYTLTSSTLLSALSGGGFTGYGGAVATVGDPFGTSGPAFKITPMAPVPEAETLAMMAPGLLMVAAIARRKKKAQIAA
jgi:hypothetical protein